VLAFRVERRGFYHPRRSHWYEQIIEAEETALRHGVDITRIQIGGPVVDG
jgi:hypothetical protein